MLQARWPEAMEEITAVKVTALAKTGEQLKVLGVGRIAHEYEHFKDIPFHITTCTVESKTSK